MDDDHDLEGARLKLPALAKKVANFVRKRAARIDRESHRQTRGDHRSGTDRRDARLIAALLGE